LLIQTKNIFQITKKKRDNIIPHHFHELTILDLVEELQQYPLLSWVHLNRKIERQLYSWETNEKLMV
jgi:hypothetical protein